MQSISSLRRGNKGVFSFVNAFISCCLVAVAVLCNAQDMSTGSLDVTVTDSAGALIPGAKLVLKDLDTNDVHTVTTKGNGAVVIPYLNPAVYSLTVSKEGFSSSQYAKVTITTNQVTNLSVALKIGSTTETVNVAADRSPILNTTSNTLSTNIDLKQVEDLPDAGTRRVFTRVPGTGRGGQQLQQSARRRGQHQRQWLLHHDEPLQERRL